MPFWYKNITTTSCSDKSYHKGTWYMHTLLRQPLRGRNKNQFFHYFGLLHNLLHRHDLPNRWFERRLKRLALFLSIFGKGISPCWFYCSNSQGNFEMTFAVISFLYVAFSFGSFYWKLKIISIRNYNQHFTFRKAWEGFCRNFTS